MSLLPNQSSQGPTENRITPVGSDKDIEVNVRTYCCLLIKTERRIYRKIISGEICIPGSVLYDTCTSWNEERRYPSSADYFNDQIFQNMA